MRSVTSDCMCTCKGCTEMDPGHCHRPETGCTKQEDPVSLYVMPRYPGEVAASGCYWNGTCSCSCSACKNAPASHCGSHGSGCHMNCSA